MKKRKKRKVGISPTGMGGREEEFGSSPCSLLRQEGMDKKEEELERSSI